jgi:hypothetical protein
VSVEVTSAGPDRPVVVLHGAPALLARRLARAGFATVTFEGNASRELALVLEALEAGTLGLRAQRYGLVERGDDGAVVLTRVEAGTRLPGTNVRSDAAVVQWLTQHVV